MAAPRRVGTGGNDDSAPRRRIGKARSRSVPMSIRQTNANTYGNEGFGLPGLYNIVMWVGTLTTGHPPGSEWQLHGYDINSASWITTQHDDFQAAIEFDAIAWDGERWIAPALGTLQPDTDSQGYLIWNNGTGQWDKPNSSISNNVISIYYVNGVYYAHTHTTLAGFGGISSGEPADWWSATSLDGPWSGAIIPKGTPVFAPYHHSGPAFDDSIVLFPAWIGDVSLDLIELVAAQGVGEGFLDFVVTAFNGGRGASRRSNAYIDGTGEFYVSSHPIGWADHSGNPPGAWTQHWDGVSGRRIQDIAAKPGTSEFVASHTSLAPALHSFSRYTNDGGYTTATTDQGSHFHSPRWSALFNRWFAWTASGASGLVRLVESTDGSTFTLSELSPGGVGGFSGAGPSQFEVL